MPAAERFKLKRIEIRNERIERLGEKATRLFPKATPFDLEVAFCLLPFGNNEFEPDSARQSLLASIEREETFEFELKRTGDVQNIERSATDRGCVLTT